VAKPASSNSDRHTAEGEATFASPDAVMVAATAPAGNEAWIGHPFAEVQQRIHTARG
jgi:hypothetical protein